MKRIAIFVPGYYGSTLKDVQSKRLIWGDPKEVLLGRKSLALPIAGIKIPGALDLFPESLIPDQKIFGGLLKEDAYDKTMALLHSLNCDEVIAVAWDWRKDPIDGIRRLDQAVKQAKQKYPHHQLILASHSFGSLIASYFLRYGAQDFMEAKENWEGLKYFSKIVLSASPYRGLMAIFRNMHFGIKFGLNHNMQTPLAFSTFESSYYLLPMSGHDFILDELGQQVSLGLFDINNWIKNRWGLFHEQLKFPSETMSIRENFVHKHLERAKKFHQLIHDDFMTLPEKRPHLLYLTGHGHKTVHRGVWLKNKKDQNIFLYYPKHFKKWKTPHSHEIVFGDGDATVPDFSLKLPIAFEKLGTKVHQSKLGHLETLQHQSTQKIITDFLNS